MIWVSWRQHRGQAIACLGLLAALAVYAIVVSTSMRTAFSGDGLAACLARSPATSCRAAISAFTDRFGSEVNVAFWSVLLILPGLIGVLVGAPLIARELEYGTWRLAWSQTVPRARWLAVKLALVTGGVIVLGAAMTAVITWYRAPMDRLTGHLEHNIYDFEGLVLTAYILCAFGFAVLAGLLLRRSIPAMVAAFIPWLAIRLVVEFVFRPHFLTPLTMTALITWYRAPMDRLTGRFLPNIFDFEGLVLTAYILCAFGFAVLAGLLLRRSIPAMVAAFIPWLAIRLVVEFLLRPHFQAPLTFRQVCPQNGPCFGGAGLGFLPPVTGHIGDWVLGPGGSRLGNQSVNTYLYQPADRFWTFQFIEAGLFVLLTAAALGATIWLLHRRAA